MFCGNARNDSRWSSTCTGLPLNMQEVHQDGNPYFHTKELSLEDRLCGSNLHGSWILWWFLGEHAGLQHVAGLFFSMGGRAFDVYRTGELTILRAILENHNLDLGDVWATDVVAHSMRTWDFKYGEKLAALEQFVDSTTETFKERKTCCFH
jgi:hypothetical protein